MAERAWRQASQRTSHYAVENQTYWRITCRLHDGFVAWRGWFRDRADADAFFYALWAGTLHQEPALWNLPIPNWNSDIDRGLLYSLDSITFITASPGSNQTYNVPLDFNPSKNNFDTHGAGSGGVFNSGAGAASGAGGEWRRTSNIALTRGGTATYQLGAKGAGSTTGTGNAGGDTWFNGANLAASSVGSKGGSAPSGGTTGGIGGGQVGNTGGVGTLSQKGGQGAAGSATSNSGSGGGGAGGLLGDGGNGVVNTVSGAGAGGGGNGGGTAGSNSGITTGGNGGDNNGGTGHGVGTTTAAGNGTNGGGGAGGGSALGTFNAGGLGSAGNEYTDNSGATAGSGGAGGGGGVAVNVLQSAAGGAAGNFGGGGGGAGDRAGGGASGGDGAQGMIVAQYNPLLFLQNKPWETPDFQVLQVMY